MKGPEKLDYFNGNWPTNKGAWFPGEKVLYREKSLFDDFQELSWMSLLIYGITGEVPSREKSEMVEKIWSICTSYPDPRIWNNRIAALAGTARSTGQLAHAAAMAVSEAKIYGGQPAYLGGDFLRGLVAEVDSGKNLEDVVLMRLKKYRYLPGFGRPIISKDERIPPLLNAAKKLGFGEGRHLSLLQSVVELLNEKGYRIKPNIAIYITAVMADIGFTPRETYYLATMTFSAGILPCFVDSVEKPEGTLFPVRSVAVNYIGGSHRRLNHE